MIIFLIGVPGSGKTTLFKEFISKIDSPIVREKWRGQLKMLKFDKRCFILGDYDLSDKDNIGEFQGTDRLSFSIVPQIKWFIEYCEERIPYYIILCEGDRINCRSLYNWLLERKIIFRIFNIEISPEQLEKNREHRKQSESFLKRTNTKVRNVKNKFQVESGDYNHILNSINETINPVVSFAVFRD